MGLSNSNDISLKVGFDIERFQATLNQTNGILNSWSGKIQSQLLSAFSIGGGIMLLKQGITAAVTSMAEFEKSMSAVKAITGASGAEFKQLRDNAIGLAGAFKALDISKLEVEFGRLGFSTKEILASTKTTIDLAVATGEDLAKSAMIAGSTLRAFNLDAKEMGRVGDVMAAAFNKSALGLDNFGEAIKYVAPVAYAAGLSLEQVSAMLGVLADNGVKGSMAGTSLRKIISDLGQGAAPKLAQELAKMAKAGLTGADAMDEVGRTAYASLLILSKNTEKVNEATEAYKNSTGELKKMADVMQDNLVGDWNKFNAAIDTTIQKSSLATVPLRALLAYYTDLIRLLNGTHFAYRLIGEQMDKMKGQPLWEKVSEKGIAGQGVDYKEKQAGFRVGEGNGLAEVKKQLELINQINDKIKEQEDLKKESSSFKEIIQYNLKIKELHDTLEKINKLGLPQNLSIKALKASDKLGRADLPHVPTNEEIFKNLTDNLGKQDAKNGLNTYLEKAKTSVFKFAQFMETHKVKIQNSFINMGSDISNGLAGAIAGTKTFAESMAQMALSVVESLERMALAYMIERSAQFGPAGIAAAIVGFGIIKGLFARIGAGGGGGGSSALPRSADSLTPQAIVIQMTGELKATGSTLSVALDKYHYSRGRIGG